MAREDAQELKELLARLTAELADRRAALPAHSARPGQMIAIEELEDQISDLQKKIREIEHEQP
jgi:hypothetical protein